MDELIVEMIFGKRVNFKSHIEVGLMKQTVISCLTVSQVAYYVGLG